MIAELRCARCQFPFRQLASEPFVTCPGCRLRSKPVDERIQRIVWQWDARRRPSTIRDEDPSYDNARRAYEG